jgi:hypothetical protein
MLWLPGLLNTTLIRHAPKTIGLVLAGNVPFVGMHDLICVLASGHNAKSKTEFKGHVFFPLVETGFSENKCRL